MKQKKTQQITWFDKFLNYYYYIIHNYNIIISISSTGLYGSATIVNSNLFQDVSDLKEQVTTLSTSFLTTTQEHRDDISQNRLDISQNRLDISSNLSKINDTSNNKIPVLESDISCNSLDISLNRADISRSFIYKRCRWYW